MLYLSPFFMMITTTLLMSTIMAISSTNWLFLWLAMELNLLSFIPMMMTTNSFQETEASIKYFLTQALGSSLLLFSSMSMWMLNFSTNYMYIILILSLIIKLGMAPCHLWYPSVMTSIPWIPAFILSTWQKLAPLTILSFIVIKTNTSMMLFITGLNAITGGLLGMNQSHLRTIMAYSSITHLGWMSALISFNFPLSTMTYFFLYTLLIMPIFLIMNKWNNSTITQMNKSMSLFNFMTLMIPMLLLSLGGMPPLTGFIPKLMTIYILSTYSMTLLLIMILGSIMNLYFYLNIVFSSYLSKSLILPYQSPMPKYTSKLYPFMATSILLLAPLCLM